MQHDPHALGGQHLNKWVIPRKDFLAKPAKLWCCEPYSNMPPVNGAGNLARICFPEGDLETSCLWSQPRPEEMKQRWIRGRERAISLGERLLS